MHNYIRVVVVERKYLSGGTVEEVASRGRIVWWGSLKELVVTRNNGIRLAISHACTECRSNLVTGFRIFRRSHDLARLGTKVLRSGMGVG
jgi:hypothetical protein